MRIIYCLQTQAYTGRKVTEIFGDMQEKFIFLCYFNKKAPTLLSKHFFCQVIERISANGFVR